MLVLNRKRKVEGQMMNIYIVCIQNVPYLPYIYGLLRVSAEEDKRLTKSYSFREVFFLNEPLLDIVNRINSPAILGLSCYVWNFRRHMKLAKLVKSAYPDTLVIAGGPAIPLQDENFFVKYPYIDILVHGEGEIPFTEILRENLLDRPNWSQIKNISYQKHGCHISTEIEKHFMNTHEMTSPYIKGYLDDAISLCRKKNLTFYALWETSRGCPYSCSYCGWGGGRRSKVRTFPMDQVKADIQYFGRQKIPNIFICDANFGMVSRDIDIAKELATAHREYGSPRQIRVNFAKNSGKRVFEISRVFSECDMLMGTTFSVQSMNANVLKAVHRTNIKLSDFINLKKKYSEAGLSTYTELILGLPMETRSSFKNGLANLLEAGNHDDIRIYEFMLLPNSDLSTAEAIRIYGLQLRDKRLYYDGTDELSDEAECAQIVVGTDTMTLEDWVECYLFAMTILILHIGGYTQFLAIHLRRKYKLNYLTFYDMLISYFESRPQSVFGEILCELRNLLKRYQEEPLIPVVHLIASQPNLVEKILQYGRRKGWTIENWGWLCISSQTKRFYKEIQDYLISLQIKFDGEIEDLLRYQYDAMLQPDYDPTQGKLCCYDYDFPNYFSKGNALKPRKIILKYKDTHMGVNKQYPLIPGDLKAFAKAAIGESYPFVRIRHYRHQLIEQFVAGTLESS